MTSEMTSDQSWVPRTPEQVATLMDGLTFDLDREIPESQLPPLLAEDEDAMVPRSFKIPQRLDAALQRIADDHHVSKSELIRRYLEAAVAAELAGGDDGEVLIPLADALRALTGLRHLPRTA